MNDDTVKERLKDYMRSIGCSENEISKTVSRSCVLCDGPQNYVGMYIPTLPPDVVSVMRTPEDKALVCFYGMCAACLGETQESRNAASQLAEDKLIQQYIREANDSRRKL